jgi:uncharacterized membrane protein
MNRKELDAFVQQHALSPAATAAAFELVEARPSAAEATRFYWRLLFLSGVLSLGAGLVFFIAANWEVLAVLGRFALVQAAFLVAIAAALWRPPPHAVGRAALLFAFIAAGALLALFGQTYQTGADVYELFLAWAVLGLVIVVAGQWGVTWAAWALVLNVALLLYCGWRPQSGWLFSLFFGFALEVSELMVAAMAVNLGLWGVTLAARGTAATALAPRWLGRFVLACAVGFATAAGVFEIVVADNFVSEQASSPVSIVLVLVTLGGLAWHALRRRDDVFPLALVAASAIVLTTVLIGAHSGLDELGLFFVLALWLIASSTFCGHWLMKAVRAWRTETADA